MRNPRTTAEWQEAVDAAKGARLLHDARLYGLVTGGPQVDAERCDFILNEGRKLGIEPRSDAAERFVDALFQTQP